MSLPSDATIRSTLAHYDRSAEEFVRRTRDIDMSATRAAFLELLPPQGKILDAGCGSGRDTAAFVHDGFSVTAFDGSGAMAALASAYSRVPVLRLTFAELVFDSEFDGVWACASLLHLPRTDIDDGVARLTAALRPNGILFMSFKGGDGEVVDAGRLTTFLSEQDLLGLLERNRHLSLIRRWTTPDSEGRPVVWVNVLARRIDPQAR